MKKPDTQPIALARELIERMSGRFEPEKMADEYARAVRESDGESRAARSRGAG
jgi:non-homologous end joining protein Ku